MFLKLNAAAGAILLLLLTSSNTAVIARDWGDLPANNNNSTAVQAASAASLNLQRSQIQARVDAALKGGQLSYRQAAELKDELWDNEHRQSHLSVDGLSYANVQSLLAELNSIDAQITLPLASDRAVLARQPAFEGGPTFRRPDPVNIDVMKSQIASRLEQGRISGRLTPAEYGRLRHELDNISMHETRMLRFCGRLTHSQIERLEFMLSGLNHRLSAELYERDYAGRDHRWY